MKIKNKSLRDQFLDLRLFEVIAIFIALTLIITAIIAIIVNWNNTLS